MVWALRVNVVDGPLLWQGADLRLRVAKKAPLQFESSERAALFRCTVIRLSRTGGRWPTAPDGRQPLPRRGPGTCCRRGGRGRGERLIEMCRARTGPRPGNVGVASAAYGRLKGEDTPCLQQRRPWPTWGSTSGRARTARARSMREGASPSGPSWPTGPTTSTGCSSGPAPARWSSSTRSGTSARWSSRAPMRTGTPAPTCQDMPRSRPAGCSPASRRPTPSTPR